MQPPDVRGAGEGGGLLPSIPDRPAPGAYGAHGAAYPSISGPDFAQACTGSQKWFLVGLLYIPE